MIKKILPVLLLPVVISSAIYSQSEQLIINLSSSSIPGILVFENPKGSIKITGYEGNVLLVTGTLRFSDKEEPAGDVMKRIEQKALDISAEVKGKEITLLCRTTGKTVDFDIKVPRDFSLKLKSLDNGTVEILNINGDIEVENSNGDISLGNISGSAVLSSVYGKISAAFREVKPDSPMMFTSFEGDITVSLPESVSARVKMKSENGEIMSDFDIKPDNRQSVVTRVDNTLVYSLEDWFAGTINAGGPEYILRSYSGNVILRKKSGLL
ncbi:MAG: DUF4097 family beta strand repeat-containing protein [Bacteroidota bacterium]